MKSIFEQMGGTYRQESDYFIPNILPDEDRQYQIGKYGRMRRRFLKEHHPILHSNLLTSGKLLAHLEETDQCCNEHMESICTTWTPQTEKSNCLELHRGAETGRGRADD